MSQWDTETTSTSSAVTSTHSHQPTATQPPMQSYAVSPDGSYLSGAGLGDAGPVGDLDFAAAYGGGEFHLPDQGAQFGNGHGVGVGVGGMASSMPFLFPSW